MKKSIRKNLSVQCAVTPLFILALSACGGSSSVQPDSTAGATTDDSTTTDDDTTTTATPTYYVATSKNALSGTNNAIATKIATDETTRKSYLEQVMETKDINTKCTSATCNVNKDIAAGTILMNYRQSYTGFAVIREDETLWKNDDGDRVSSMNSYVYFTNSPVTDKALVTNATYTGAMGEADSITDNTAVVLERGYAYAPFMSNLGFTLNVTDGSVSGNIYYDKNQTTIVTLNSADVAVNSDGVVGFDGTANFHADALYINKQEDGTYQDVSGTYNGIFAGANAEEVVGSFQTDKQEEAKNNVQGIFIGTKVSE